MQNRVFLRQQLTRYNQPAEEDNKPQRKKLKIPALNCEAKQINSARIKSKLSQKELAEIPKIDTRNVNRLL